MTSSVTRKSYVHPMAQKLDFNYEENVVASGGQQTDVGSRCGGGCKPDPGKPHNPNPWFPWWWH